MRPADHPNRPISLFDVVKRAVDIVDPDDDDADMGELEEIFEDADEPVTGVENLEERVALAVEGIDNAVENPAVSVAAAVILYLAHRRDELNADPDHVRASRPGPSGRATRRRTCATGSRRAGSPSSATGARTSASAKPHGRVTSLTSCAKASG